MMMTQEDKAKVTPMYYGIQKQSALGTPVSPEIMEKWAHWTDGKKIHRWRRRVLRIVNRFLAWMGRKEGKE
jgi:hypothetical protein